MAFNNRFDNALIYPDRQWEKIAHYKSPVFLPGDYEEIEERAGDWFQLVGNTANLAPAEPGTGIFYVTTYKDADGALLDGGKNYRLTMPADVPVRQFWQIPVYSNKTRSLINADHKRFTLDTNIKVYFCDPKSPWQRGSNENTNGLLRQYFPKGMDLSNVHQNKLNAVARQPNERPRETLNFETPAERFNQFVASIG